MFESLTVILFGPRNPDWSKPLAHYDQGAYRGFWMGFSLGMIILSVALSLILVL